MVVWQPYAYTHTPAAQSALQPAGLVCPTQTGPYIGEPPYRYTLYRGSSGRDEIIGRRGCDQGICPGSTDMTSFLMTEARQQNTEVRMSIGKVVDKVDQLSSKVRRVSSTQPPPSVGGIHPLFLTCFDR